MPNPTLSDELETALDELDMADNTITIALSDARELGLAPFRLAQIRAAIDDTRHTRRQLNQVIRALKLGDPIQKL